MMEYKSNRSDKFRAWLKDLDEEKIMRLIDLERFARLVIHQVDLTGDLDVKAVHGLARATKQIQADYEKS
jgi:hypothetical protein